MHNIRRPVLVGDDGSAAGRAAVLFAAEEAALRRAPLRIVHVLDVVHGPTLPVGGHELEAAAALAFLADSAAVARPVLRRDVTTETAYGRPAAELFARAAEADLLVVGRGQAGVFGLMLGSVALSAATHAPCPVAVVAEAGAPGVRGTVVVGVDDQEHATEALDIAFAAAEDRAARLVALHAWHYPHGSPAVAVGPLMYDPAIFARSEARVLHEAVRPYREKYPDVDVEERTVAGGAAHALVEASEEAGLLVVGTRGHGAMHGTVLGSVSLAAIRHAHCPVLVARAHAAGGEWARAAGA